MDSDLQLLHSTGWNTAEEIIIQRFNYTLCDRCSNAHQSRPWLKPLDTFGTDKKFKVHRFTNNLKGLQKVMVKDFSWNIIPGNALLFEKTLKQYQFSKLRITDLF